LSSNKAVVGHSIRRDVCIYTLYDEREIKKKVVVVYIFYIIHTQQHDEKEKKRERERERQTNKIQK